MEPVGRTPVDATRKKEMDEPRVARGIDVGAVVTIVVDGLTFGEDLKHRAEALHDGLHFAPAKYIAACDGDARAFFGEKDRRGFADAGGSSGDKSDFVLQAHVIRLGEPLPSG